ncbi:acyltransferase family protein [Alphaproteobacteria bacterium]|nr:acyltransferase family protein [Alphaproteobacteria bacterium]
MNSFKLSHRDDIDGLRGIAVLSVIFYHMGFSLFEGGFVGVDVFFVISGYLITRSVVSDVKRNQFSILGFYNRRIRRILPSLLVVLLITMIFGFFVMPPPSYEELSKSSISALFFYSNFYFQSEVDYFDTVAELKPLLHTWSLAIEEQFYLVFPILAFLSKSLRAFTVFVFIIFLATLFLFFITSAEQSEVFFFPQFRVWELGLGSLCSLVEFRSQPLIKRLKGRLFAYIGFIGILLSILFFDSKGWPNSIAIIPVLSTFLILFNSNKVSLLNSGLLIFFGRRSYSFYLVHYPIISFSYYIVGVSLTYFQTLVVAFLIFIIGVLLFHSVEQRFTRTKATLSQSIFTATNRTLGWFVSGFSAVVLAISLIGVSTDGYMLNPNKDKLKKVASTIKREHIMCSAKEPFSACLKAQPNAKVVLIGDSNAYHFAVGAKKNSPKNEIILFAKGGCLPLVRFTRLEQTKSFNNKCMSWNDEVNELFQTDFPKGRVVVVSAAWLLYLYGDNLYQNEPMSKLANFGNTVLGNDDFEPIAKDQKIVEMRQYLIDLVNTLSKKFENVVILGPLPPQPFAVQSETKLQFYGHNGTSSKLFYSYAEPLLEVFEEIKSLQLSNVNVILPHVQLCDAQVKERCVGFVDGEHYYGDEFHVSAIGQYVAYSELFKYLKNL